MKNIDNRIAELQQIADQSKELIKVKRYDFADNTDVKSFKKYTQALFKNRITLMKSYGQQNCAVDLSELNSENLTRRSAAILRLAENAQNRYQTQYPSFSVAQTIADLCAPCPTDTFNGLDSTRRIELAAAIWILDHLKNSSKLDDALEYMPESRDELDRIDLPDASDSVHSDDLIRGMLHVIRFRNCGLNGFDPSSAFMDNADATAAIAGRSDSECRSRFDGIMSLIEPDTVSELRKRFIENVRQLTESCLALYDKLQSSVITLTETKIRMIEEEIADVRQTESALNVLNDQSDGTETTLPVVGDMQASDNPLTEVTCSGIHPSCTREEAMRVEEALQTAVFRRENFCLNIMLLCAERKHKLREIIGNELLKLLPESKTNDPYEMCFAFLSLLYTDSDAVWCYNLPYIVLEDACRSLPWANGISGQKQPEVTPAFYEAAKNAPEQHIVQQSQSILNRRLIKRPFVGPGDDKISFSQLVYQFSGLVPPRGMPELSYIKALFDDSILTKNEIDILYEYFTLACSLAQRDENYVFVDEEDETTEDVQNDDRENDDSARELRELKRENKNLKAMANKLEHRLRESADALNSISESLDEANAELGELRSMIRETDNSKKEYSVTVSFPYTAKKRSIVFGGHSTWLKAIRPLLPDVRFIEPSAQPNTGLILNADVVWIQTNALSHSDFYKIIDVVRKHNIELHYFTYASAEKCAEQFALNDMADTQENSENE
ncbi:MAG: hypothetical protein IJH07_02350 [Ruminococcus sp.]|nr:hypothetical protein [Ruminococcus sp.]